MSYRSTGFRLLLAGFVVLVLLTACNTPQNDKVIRFGLATAINNMDPRFSTDATSERINRLLYSRLVSFNENLMPVPSLASWEKISPSRYRFTLINERPTFSNGERLEANDIQASFEFILNPENRSPHRESISIIRKIRVIDDKTIEFLLSKADPLFPAYLDIAILPESLIKNGHDFNRQPVGSGNFVFSGQNGEQSWLFERRNDHQKVEFIKIQDPTVRVLKLLQGEIDLLQNDLPPELAGYLQKSDKINTISRKGNNFTYIGFNLDDPDTGNHTLRKAIAHAIDREKIVEYVFNDSARLADSILPPYHWAGVPDLKSYDYNPELARRLLRKNGYGYKNPLKLGFKTSADPFRVKLATILQWQLKQVGIDLKIESFDWGTFFGDIKAGRFQMYSLSWVGIKTPDIFRYIFHSQSLPPSGANRGHYHSLEMDRLLDMASKAETVSVQASYYEKVQRLLQADLPYVPLWYENQTAWIRKNISGYSLTADGRYDALNHILKRNPVEQK